MPTMKYAASGPEFQRDAKEYVINMLGKKRKLHKKDGCQHSKCYAKYYDFDTEEDAATSGIAFTYCEICFPEKRHK